MSRRAVTVVGLTAAGGVGYYLYTAGGDPKVAQKNFKADAAEAQAKIKSDVPAREKEFEKKGEAMASRAGQTLDRTVDEARGKLTEAQAKAQEYKERTSKEMKGAIDTFDSKTQAKAREIREKTGQEMKEVGQAIDSFDSKVEKKASEAKNGISSWFGFGGK